MDFGGKRMEKLGLSGHSVACTTGVSYQRVASGVSQTQQNENAYTSFIFFNDYPPKKSLATSALTFRDLPSFSIIFVCDLNFDSACDIKDDDRA